MQAVCEILGSGTSVGVPMLACDCPCCTSDDPKNKRLRSSARIKINGLDIIIDTTTDFRQQALRSNLRKVDVILFTHNHADHIFGLDDIRPFCFKQSKPIPVYGNTNTLKWIRSKFDYIWEASQIGGGLPQITLNTVNSEFTYDKIKIIPIPVMHGNMEIFGYRIGDFTYISDVSFIPESSFKLLEGTQFLVLDGPLFKPHSTHFCIDEAVEAAQKINAQQTWLTHLGHGCIYDDLNNYLPDNIMPAYDGLEFSFNY